MALNKVEICGVNTARLPILTNEEKDALLPWLKTLDDEKYQVLATFFYNWKKDPPIPIFIIKN